MVFAQEPQQIMLTIMKKSAAAYASGWYMSSPERLLRRNSSGVGPAIVLAAKESLRALRWQAYSALRIAETIFLLEEVAKDRAFRWLLRKADPSTTRPDAPNCGAEEKLGPLRSE